MTMTDLHDGGCLCGTLRYRIIGAPARGNVCHCRFCQRLTGSAFLVEPVFLKPQVSFTVGAPRTYDHRGEHGRILRLYFCGHCSVKVGLTFERFPDHFGICGGTFDDPQWFQPTRHIFTTYAVPWMRYPEAVDCFAEHAVKADGTPEVPWQRGNEQVQVERKPVPTADGPWPCGGG
jgi:hypothetical protein